MNVNMEEVVNDPVEAGAATNVTSWGKALLDKFRKRTTTGDETANQTQKPGMLRHRMFRKRSSPSFFAQLWASVRRIQLKKRRRRWITVSEIVGPLFPLLILMIVRYSLRDKTFKESYEETKSFDVWNSNILRDRMLFNYSSRVHEAVVLHPAVDKTMYEDIRELGIEMKQKARQYFQPPLETKITVLKEHVKFPNPKYFAAVTIYSVKEYLNYTVTLNASYTTYSIPVISSKEEMVSLDQCRKLGDDGLPLTEKTGEKCDAARYYKSGYISLVALINFSWLSVSST